MSRSLHQLARLVKRTSHVPRWMFIPFLLLGTIGTLYWIDSLITSFGYGTLLLYLGIVGVPILVSRSQRVRRPSGNFVFYYTQRAPHEIGFHLRRRRLATKPTWLDLEFQTGAELCAGLRVLRDASPCTLNISSLHFSSPEHLSKLKQAVLQFQPSDIVEIGPKKLGYLSALVVRLAVHRFRWKTPIASIKFLHAMSKETCTAGLRVHFAAPNNSFKPTPLRGAA